ncbi:hypothetical protein M5689_002250 [Euphorbia peplus]|nr:hypothetical protein M5689_002250 [Euphorbia peplus]
MNVGEGWEWSWDLGWGKGNNGTALDNYCYKGCYKNCTSGKGSSASVCEKNCKPVCLRVSARGDLFDSSVAQAPRRFGALPPAMALTAENNR